MRASGNFCANCAVRLRSTSQPATISTALCDPIAVRSESAIPLQPNDAWRILPFGDCARKSRMKAGAQNTPAIPVENWRMKRRREERIMGRAGLSRIGNLESTKYSRRLREALLKHV